MNYNGTNHEGLPPPAYPPPASSNLQNPALTTSSISNNHKKSSLASSSLRYRTFNTAFGPISINKFLRKDWIKYYVIIFLICVAVGLVTIYHHQIVRALHPWAQSMRDLKVGDFEVGWLIPVAVLFIISFPPLFGHEIVIILCGLVWGLWVGFAIVSLGTLLGELGNYFAFKYACSHRAEKLEKKDLNFACMCTVVRQGGFWIAFLARLSAIPGHLVTPVFATTGMTLWVFTAAAVLSMPKQLSGVYIGTLFTTEESGQPRTTAAKIVQYGVLAVTFLVTIFAAGYIYRQMAKVRAEVEERWAAERATPESQQEFFHGTESFPLGASDRRGQDLAEQRPAMNDSYSNNQFNSNIYNSPGACSTHSVIVIDDDEYKVAPHSVNDRLDNFQFDASYDPPPPPRLRP